MIAIVIVMRKESIQISLIDVLMAKAIPPVRCNIIFAECTRRPSIVLSLSLSLVFSLCLSLFASARVRQENGAVRFS